LSIQTLSSKGLAPDEVLALFFGSKKSFKYGDFGLLFGLIYKNCTKFVQKALIFL